MLRGKKWRMSVASLSTWPVIFPDANVWTSLIIGFFHDCIRHHHHFGLFIMCHSIGTSNGSHSFVMGKYLRSSPRFLGAEMW